MDVAYVQAVRVPLTATERDQVQRAAEASGQTTEQFMRHAILAAAADPFLAALEQAADTVAARARGDVVRHDYAG